jgi:hypothetical protein
MPQYFSCVFWLQTTVIMWNVQNSKILYCKCMELKKKYVKYKNIKSNKLCLTLLNFYTTKLVVPVALHTFTVVFNSLDTYKAFPVQIQLYNMSLHTPVLYFSHICKQSVLISPSQITIQCCKLILKFRVVFWCLVYSGGGVKCCIVSVCLEVRADVMMRCTICPWNKWGSRRCVFLRTRTLVLMEQDVCSCGHVYVMWQVPST